MRWARCGWVVWSVAGLLGTSALMARPQGAQSVDEGVYTREQAARGQTVYSARCSGCHADDLSGRSGPPLVGADFDGHWSAQPLLELANKIGRTMPRDESPRLTSGESADVLAYILQAGQFPAGTTELVMDDAALSRIAYPRGTVAAAPSAPVEALPPTGNVAQVMRGILFPSSNIIFTTQSIDPGEQRPPADSGTGGFDWLTWGGGVYRGWELVDYAAVSVAESAQLMLTPGRRCENGTPVPFDDPEWIRLTMELAEAGRAAYRASQTRDQATIADSTNQLNASCTNCHRVYRGRTHCVMAARG